MQEKISNKFRLFLVLLVFLTIFGLFLKIDKSAVESFFSQISFFYASVLFIFLYIIGTFFIWYLKDPLKVIGAFLFGAYFSTLFIYIAEIVNACIFFRLSKILGKDFVEKKISGKFKNIYEKLGNLDTVSVALLRAIPLVPYRVLDLSFGLTSFSLRRYLVIVILASLPRIFIIQFILSGVSTFSQDAIMKYFLENINVLRFYFLYFFLSFVVIFKIRGKVK